MDRDPDVSLEQLIGKPIFIAWKSPQDDWNHFTLLDVREDRIRVQGRHSPDGWRHDGDRFWATLSSIRLLREGD